MKSELKLLMLEDDPEDAMLIQRLLKRSGMSFDATVAGDEKEFLSAIRQEGFDAVLADNALPQYSSMEALKMLQEHNPHIAFILVTGTVSEEFAVNIIQQGADDYILKTNLTRLPSAINKAIEKKKIQKAKDAAEERTEREKYFSGSIINSLPGIFFLANSRGEVLRYNSNFVAVSGFDASELTTMHPSEFFKQPDQVRIAEWIGETLANGSAEIEADLLTKDNHQIPYYFTGSSINFEGESCVAGIGLDISVRKQSEFDLKQLNQELRALAAHMEKIREEEQTRIAREIHDQLGQQLTGLKMDASWLKKKTADNSELSIIHEKLLEMLELLDESITTVRRVAADLRPSILDDLGLIPAIDWASRNFEKRSGTRVELELPDESTSLDPTISTALFRMFQEALTNIARHAEATLINASLIISSDHLLLSIIDNGKGFDVNQPTKSLGLVGMKERALMVGGGLVIDSAPGKGTRLTIRIPL